MIKIDERMLINYMQLQKDVLYYLEKYGIKQSHMAENINVSRQQLSSWLHGKLVLPGYHMVAITTYLNRLKEMDKYLTDKGLIL